LDLGPVGGSRNKAATKRVGTKEDRNLLLHGKIYFDSDASQMDVIIRWKPRRNCQWLVESESESLSLDQIEGNAPRRNSWLRFCYEIHGLDLNISTILKAKFGVVCEKAFSTIADSKFNSIHNVTWECRISLFITFRKEINAICPGKASAHCGSSELQIPLSHFAPPTPERKLEKGCTFGFVWFAAPGRRLPGRSSLLSGCPHVDTVTN
jgi:hypothetical protein